MLESHWQHPGVSLLPYFAGVDVRNEEVSSEQVKSYQQGNVGRNNLGVKSDESAVRYRDTRISDGAAAEIIVSDFESQRRGLLFHTGSHRLRIVSSLIDANHTYFRPGILSRALRTVRLI